MKPLILTEKPSKAYADDFSVRKYEGYSEIKPCPIFPLGAHIIWGMSVILSN
ncbi:topoisomerase [Bacillus sp. OxB-1]|uniref:hypothetical protein n=1 Tax=Bacillus sp. (strain OxB-1) TaxID=98228 RepID=UPI0005820854|nr:hypothetical protein [Bacillus sp. OxB-1]BAQ09539.1 topoisomerase [Bacillus sp. OxB-1]